jgi:hypothetical protein
MNNLLLRLIEVLKPAQDLRDDKLGLFFGDLTILLQVEIEVGARA